MQRRNEIESFRIIALCAALVCALALASTPQLLADSPAPSNPWKKEVGGYVFVMLFAGCKHESVEVVLSNRELERLRELRGATRPDTRRRGWSDGNLPMFESCRRRTVAAEPRVMQDFGDAALVRMSTSRVTYSQSVQSSTGAPYPASGLYRNDGSVEPLWTVDWFADGAIPSADGVHLVRLGPWASDYDELAVAFYRSGVLLKAYSIADLVSEPEELMHTVSHFFWARDISLDDADGELTVATLTGETYRFDLDGNMLSRTAAPKNEQSIRVHYSDGGKEELGGVHTCTGTMYLIASMTEGSAAKRLLYAYRIPVDGDERSEPEHDNPKPTFLEVLHVPLDRIRGMRRTDHPVPRDGNNRGWDERAWLIRLEGGQSMLTALDVAELGLCAETAGGERKVLTLEDVTAIEFL